MSLFGGKNFELTLHVNTTMRASHRGVMGHEIYIYLIYMKINNKSLSLSILLGFV